MAENSLIEWCDDTRNAVNGCSVLSPGCTNCYAMRLAGTRLRHHPSRAGLTRDSKAGPVWTGDVRLNEKELLAPLRQKRGRRIFWNAHGDLFHEAVPDEWIDRLFAVCALTPQHTHMILTKRPERMRSYMTSVQPFERMEAWDDAARLQSLVRPMPYLSFPLPNVLLGTSVEDQARADERIPHLRETPAAVRFISFEPLLSAVETDLTGIDWAIIGTESGPRPRHMDNAWAQGIVDQCRAADVAVFVKQLSSGGPRPIHDIEQFPEGLRHREFPR